jgi:hypothetical protein
VVNVGVNGERGVDGGHVGVKHERVFHVQVRDRGTFFQQERLNLLRDGRTA